MLAYFPRKEKKLKGYNLTINKFIFQMKTILSEKENMGGRE